jgi:Double zinc ribbon
MSMDFCRRRECDTDPGPEQWSRCRQDDKWGRNRCATGGLMRCSKCGSDNPTGKRFCGDCGAQLTDHCPKCGAENPPRKRFCGDCGTALAPRNATQSAVSSLNTPNAAISAEQTPDLTDGERKTVTALFADIRGSTELMEELDPAEARRIVDPALKLMIDAATTAMWFSLLATGYLPWDICPVRCSGRARGPSAARALCGALDAGAIAPLFGEGGGRRWQSSSGSHRREHW